jgi:hypothetical protein
MVTVSNALQQGESSGSFTGEQLREANRVLHAACARAAVFGPPPTSRVASARTCKLQLVFAVDHYFDVQCKWSSWESGPGEKDGRIPYRSDAHQREIARQQLALANQNARRILARYWPDGLRIGFSDNKARYRLGWTGPSLIDVGECEDCNGAGEVRCSYCGGIGTERELSCHCSSGASCDCSSFVTPCSSCNGSGRRSCGPCEATGVVHQIGRFWLFHNMRPDVSCVFEEDNSDFELLNRHETYQSMLAHADVSLDWKRVAPEMGYVARFESEGILTPTMMELQVGGQTVSIASATPHDMANATHIAARMVTEFDLDPAWQQRVPLLFHIMPPGLREQGAMRFLEHASRSPGLVLEVEQPGKLPHGNIVRLFADYVRMAALLRSLRPAIFCFSVLTFLLFAWLFGLSIMKSMLVPSMAVLAHPGIFLTLCAISIVPILRTVKDNNLPEPLRFLWLWRDGWQWIPALAIPVLATVAVALIYRSIDYLSHLF